jgi:hypothetical protein
MRVRTDDPQRRGRGGPRGTPNRPRGTTSSPWSAGGRHSRWQNLSRHSAAPASPPDQASFAGPGPATSNSTRPPSRASTPRPAPQHGRSLPTTAQADADSLVGSWFSVTQRSLRAGRFTPGTGLNHPHREAPRAVRALRFYPHVTGWSSRRAATRPNGTLTGPSGPWALRGLNRHLTGFRGKPSSARFHDRQKNTAGATGVSASAVSRTKRGLRRAFHDVGPAAGSTHHPRCRGVDVTTRRRDGPGPRAGRSRLECAGDSTSKLHRGGERDG